MPYIQDALGMIVEVLLGFYLVLLILRFLFQLLRVDFRNPVAGAIVKITNPPLRIFRRFVPGLYGIDLASVVLILLVAFLKTFFLLYIDGYMANPAGLLVYGLGESLNITCWVLLIAIFASVVLSWIAPHSHNPAARIVDGISDAVLRPFRRLMPNLGGLDITPIFAILAINLVQRLVVNPLFDWSRTLV
jgi:YggT family protein